MPFEQLTMDDTCIRITHTSGSLLRLRGITSLTVLGVDVQSHAERRAGEADERDLLASKYLHG